jgi:hypothetical protein
VVVILSQKKKVYINFKKGDRVGETINEEESRIEREGTVIGC